MPSQVQIQGKDAQGKPREVLVDVDGTVHVTGAVTATVDETTLAKAAQLPASLGSTTPAGSVSVTAALAPSIASLADITGITTSPVALGALSAGPTGIMVTAHPSNGAVILRVSGTDVSTTQGQPLAAGASYVFSVANASALKVCAESGTGTLCVSAV